MSATSSNSDSTDTSNTRQRQPAKRVFAEEYHNATHHFSDGEGERAPKFALLPTGDRANRLAVVGTLTETENIGNDTDYWQARVVDPTGTHYAYAGQYQPEAMHQLEALDPPAYVAVVGKPRTYNNENATYTSLTIEAVTVVDAATRDRWVLETAAHTYERIEAFRSEDPPTDAGRASDHYGDDLTAYEACVEDAFESLATDNAA
jgi:RPA family protein